MVTWQWLSFAELNNHQLYELLKLRVDVFVVEQSCPYPELDNKDRITGVKHLLGYRDGQLIACARLLPPGISYPSVSIGRIATHPSVRGDGLGHLLLTQALQQCQALWPEQAIEIGAQQYLAKFYCRYGFVPTSQPYLEDGILHIDMKRSE
ncbi:MULTISPECIES: GNAT family N-acetyltransferase [Vibrio]|uniref:GNAT family N-acetyltransferase n=1 Tax=Vibrio TaxID=662 RepID=UPI000C16F50B|nr:MULTISPECIES: GNAT family N-acetyltransferase [Vibrio]NAW67795.1 GNAT family N-acetyltransferase [Vibrio sp. V28_P6S34P95]NAX05722.1 GNAT family N-acetyltransferase [Vibrio sp. V30_P3S12P165]NAX35124.1 GNAT family N-acetyltransferase [Vibrio sp. V29_P1S30P107]NAX36713.1 GNAT family N-acetyltransferase [Vibrio sp. V27_P1S3P104]NAX40129.1 GNAT family N-acetyltransferase [Vibrio sp. V26_P1S5P106]